MRHTAAVFSFVMAVILLGAVVVEAVQGRLLEVQAGRVDWWTVALLVLWFVAIIYTAWPLVAEEWRDR